MHTKRLMLGLIVAGSMLTAAHAQSAPDQDKTQTQDKARVQDHIYGSQLMTDAERAEYRAKMRSLKTQQERDAFRSEHHKLMQERARERGVQLPGMPPAQGGGMGPGGGMGGGMGPGGGMGGGRGR